MTSKCMFRFLRWRTPPSQGACPRPSPPGCHWGCAWGCQIYISIKTKWNIEKKPENLGQFRLYHLIIANLVKIGRKSAKIGQKSADFENPYFCDCRSCWPLPSQKFQPSSSNNSWDLRGGCNSPPPPAAGIELHSLRLLGLSSPFSHQHG